VFTTDAEHHPIISVANLGTGRSGSLDASHVASGGWGRCRPASVFKDVSGAEIVGAPVFLWPECLLCCDLRAGHREGGVSTALTSSANRQRTALAWGSSQAGQGM
jgi:hypothetical protein